MSREDSEREPEERTARSPRSSAVWLPTVATTLVMGAVWTLLNRIDQPPLDFNRHAALAILAGTCIGLTAVLFGGRGRAVGALCGTLTALCFVGSASLGHAYVVYDASVERWSQPPSAEDLAAHGDLLERTAETTLPPANATRQQITEFLREHDRWADSTTEIGETEWLIAESGLAELRFYVTERPTYDEYQRWMIDQQDVQWHLGLGGVLSHGWWPVWTRGSPIEWLLIALGCLLGFAIPAMRNTRS